MTRFLKNVACTMATGYILFAFSERVFWAVWRPGSNFADVALTWLAYCAVAYLFLAIVSWSRANDVWSVFLAGACYGWLVEGGLADTLYGTQESAPFPISISITGLSWHALISVMLGWWATGRALETGEWMRLIWISLAVGMFWGLWAMFPRRESPPLMMPITEFFVNAALLTAGLIVAWWVSFRAGLRGFRPRWIGLMACTLVVVVFYCSHAAMVGIGPLVLLPIVLTVAVLSLDRHRRKSAGSVPAIFFSNPGLWQLGILWLIPITATITYAVAVALEMDRLAIPEIVYVVTGLAGIILLLVSIVTILRGGAYARDL